MTDEIGVLLRMKCIPRSTSPKHYQIQVNELCNNIEVIEADRARQVINLSGNRECDPFETRGYCVVILSL